MPATPPTRRPWISHVVPLSGHPPPGLFSLVAIAVTVRAVCFVGLGYNDDDLYLHYSFLFHRDLPFEPALGYHGTRLAVILPVAGFWNLFGIGEISSAAYFLGCSVGTVAVARHIAAKLFDPRTAWTTGLLLAVFPVDVIFATQVGPDVPLTFFLLLLVAFCFELIPGDGRFPSPARAGATAFAAGLCLGALYFTKETFVLAFPVMLLTGLYAAARRGRTGAARGAPRLCACFLVGFLVVYLPAQWYFTRLSGEFAAPEKMRAHAAVQDRNSNLDFMKYPRAMLNVQQDLYRWHHRLPACGFMYWAFFIGTPLILFRRSKRPESVYVLLWAYGFIFFCQYFLYLFATYISPRPVVQPRHLRFLLLVSPPLCMATAHFLHTLTGPSARRWTRTAGHLATAFLVGSSLYYAHSGARFLRGGMNDLRRAAAVIASLDDRPVYVPDKWSVYKLRFFSAYRPAYLKRDVRLYGCGWVDCDDPCTDRGRTLSDAYVITGLSPYTRIPGTQGYPAFATDPPAHWKRLETIDNRQFGVFATYNPQVYRVPPVPESSRHGAGKTESGAVPALDEPEARVRGGRFFALEEGVVWDARTDLQWLAGPAETVDWWKARSWARGLAAGSGGWRLPTLKELNTLHLGSAVGYPVDLVIPNPRSYVWSAETPAPARAVALEMAARRPVPLYKIYAGIARAVAVRTAGAPARRGDPWRPVIRLPSSRRFDHGRGVVIVGSLEGGNRGAAAGSVLQWFSDRDGFLGTGGSPPRADLSMGLHTVSLVAAAVGGAFRGAASVKVPVSGPFETVCNPAGICFERLPAGTFTMGSPREDPQRRGDERPHRVTLTRDLFVQSTEVTRAQWAAVTGREPPGPAGCPDCPATGMSWEEARDFAARLNTLDGRDYRLPTEAEWEYAARAGDGPQAGRLGSREERCPTDPEEKKVWYAGNAHGAPRPAGTRDANAWGLFDMQGNVWEWCRDWYGDYPGAAATDPAGPPSGDRRVVRGGSYDNRLPECGAARRNAFPPGHRGGNIGFRLVFTPGPRPERHDWGATH